MGIAERKGRERARRGSRIVAAARAIAEREGRGPLDRRLADEIEYSQPVLYSHFENRDAIVGAVAVEGFQEFTVAIREAASGSTGRRNALENVAFAYLAFAHSRPAPTRPCLSCPRICGSPKLRPDRNYGPPTRRLRQW